MATVPKRDVQLDLFRDVLLPKNTDEELIYLLNHSLLIVIAEP